MPVKKNVRLRLPGCLVEYHDELQRLLRWAVWRQRMQRTTVTDPCFDMISSVRSLSVSNVYRDPCEKPDRCTLLSLYAVACFERSTY